MKLWQGSFSQNDFDRMAHVARVHGHEADAGAVRFAIREQAARSAGPTTEMLRPLYEAAARSAVEMRGRWQRANQHASTQTDAATANATRPHLTRWSFRCNVADLNRMDAIASAHGLRRRAEAVRFAVFVQAALDGYNQQRRRSHAGATATQ